MSIDKQLMCQSSPSFMETKILFVNRIYKLYGN